MKKSIICLLLALCLCLSVVLLSSCKKLTDITGDPTPVKGTTEVEKKGEAEFTQSTEEGTVLPKNDDSTNQIVDGTRRY